MKIFICYAHEDLGVARQLYQELTAATGHTFWMDAFNLLPGQEWRKEIVNAIRESDLFLSLLSKHTIDKTGFVQFEIRIALEEQQLRPEGARFVIPVRLEECQPHFKDLSERQCCDLFPDWRSGVEELIELCDSGVGQAGTSTHSRQDSFEPTPVTHVPEAQPATCEPLEPQAHQLCSVSAPVAPRRQPNVKFDPIQEEIDESIYAKCGVPRSTARMQTRRKTSRKTYDDDTCLTQNERWQAGIDAYPYEV